MTYNPINEQFKDYLEIYGALATQGNNNLKGFIKEIKDERGSRQYFYTSDSIDKSSPLVIGDITYLIKNKEMEHGHIYTRCLVVRSNHVIKTYINNVLYNIPCVIENTNNTLASASHLSLVEGRLTAMVGDNPINRQLTRIIYSNNAWVTIGYMKDNQTLYYTFDKSLVTNSDDLPNEITNKPNQGFPNIGV